MLVLALEFSRVEPARGTHPTTDDLAAERARTGRAAAEPSRAPRRRRRRTTSGRSLKTEERKPGGAGVLEAGPDGLPGTWAPEGAHVRSLAGVGGGPATVGENAHGAD